MLRRSALSRSNLVARALSNAASVTPGVRTLTFQPRLRALLAAHRELLLFVANKSTFAVDDAAACDGAIRAAVDEYAATVRKTSTSGQSAGVSGEAFFVQHVHRLMPLQYQRLLQDAAQQHQPAIDVSQLEAMTRRQIVVARRMAPLGPSDEARELMVAKYVQFLQLAKERRGRTVVPTLAIDMVWHAYMQQPKVYCRDTKRVCGFVLDHSDEIPDWELEQKRQETREAWNRKFGSSNLYDPPTRIQIVPKGGLPKAEADTASRVSTHHTGACFAAAATPIAVAAACGGVGGCNAACAARCSVPALGNSGATGTSCGSCTGGAIDSSASSSVTSGDASTESAAGGGDSGGDGGGDGGCGGGCGGCGG